MTDTSQGYDPWLYPLHWGDTLANHEWMPLYLNRLLESKFVSYACAKGQRAEAFTAMLLWCESMKQNPAGTLPDDDIDLARMAGFGPDVDGWLAVREGALYGWRHVIITDAPPNAEARFGHETIAGIVFDMHKRKRGRDQARDAAKVAVQKSRVRKKLRELHMNRQAESDFVVDAASRWLRDNDLYITDDNVRAAVEAAAGVPRVVAFGGEMN